MKVQEQRANYFVIPKMDSAVFKVARLGDVADSMKNGLYKPASEYGDDGVPCLRMYNIIAGKIVWRDIKRMRVSASELEDYGLVEGDLLVNRVNSRELVGKTALIPPSMGPSVFESKNIRLRLRTDQALPKFINYQLLAFGRQHFSNNAQQVVGMASVSQKQLADFPIVLTSLDQQKRIVAEIEKQFSRLDEAVANLKRIKANLKRYKAAVLKAAVEGRLVETEAERARREGRSFETGAQLLQRILETRRSQWQGKGKYKEPAAPVLPELPDGWAAATLDMIAKTASGGTPRRDIPSNYGGGIPWVKSGELGDSVVTSTEETVSVEGLGSSSAKIFPKGTLCVALYGATVGKLGLLAIDAATNQAVCGIFPLDGIDNRYLRLYLEAIRGKLIRLGQGGAQPNISQEILRDLVVPIPSVTEQGRIVAEVDRRLSLLRETEAQVDANLQRAERLRRAVLSNAFSGNSHSLSYIGANRYGK